MIKFAEILPTEPAKRGESIKASGEAERNPRIIASTTHEPA
jgi:hypothetical protein